MKYSVSLAFMSWETGTVEADNEEQALEKARELYDEGEWDGRVFCSERMEKDDSVSKG